MAFSLNDYRNETLVADGDWRLELRSRGWPTSEMMEPAVLRKSEIFRDVAEAFLDAGARILVTPTEAANAVAMAEQVESGRIRTNEVAAINRRAAAICKAAVSDYAKPRRWVFGALGPPEEMLMLQEVEESDLEDAYRVQAQALVEGGVDVLICRHFSEVQAILPAVRAARGTGLPVIACMTFDCGADYAETTLGATIPQMCAALIEAGVDGLGCDGGENSDSLPGQAAAIRKAVELPVFVSVNAGVAQLFEGRAVYPEKPAEFAGRLKALIVAGANIIAGGRGASAEHIGAMVKARRESRK